MSSDRRCPWRTTNRANWIVGVDLCEGNPYDGHTLAKAITTVEKTTGVSVTDAYVDKGYRGHDYSGKANVHLAGSSSRKLTRTKKKRRKRRSAVEPKIGHLKSDNRMRSCFLKGLAGGRHQRRPRGGRLESAEAATRICACAVILAQEHSVEECSDRPTTGTLGTNRVISSSSSYLQLRFRSDSSADTTTSPNTPFSGTTT